MGSIVVVIVIAAIAFTWIRGAKRNRARWLAKLDLPGSWDREGNFGRLELSGVPDRGKYRFFEGAGGNDEAGRWRLEGHVLRMSAESGEVRDYDLRLFREGKIGIDGPGREQRIYQKIPSNVVPLRGHSGG